MSTATKPIVLNETYADKMDDLKSALVTAINGVSLGNYVIVNINNYTWGSVSGAGVYPVGSPVTLRATPSEDCFFLAWRNADGAILSIAPVYTFTPSGNTVIQADFNADEFVECVSWANGTEVQLNAMLDAHYRGVIDIHDYWHAGDTRSEHLSAMSNYIGDQKIVKETHNAQDTEWVLMDSTLKGFSPASEEYSSLAFGVGMKNCLETKGSLAMTDGETTLGWKGTSRRIWANNIFAGSLPENFITLFKPFKWKLYTSTLEEIEDTFALPLSKMIGVGIESSNAVESDEYLTWSWYTIEENKIKTANGVASDYYSGSKGTGATNRMIFVKENGTLGNLSAGSSSVFTVERGLSLFGCI